MPSEVIVGFSPGGRPLSENPATAEAMP